MPNVLSFEAAWRDRIPGPLWFLLFGCIPEYFIGYLLNDLLHQDAPILAVGLAWMAGCLGWRPNGVFHVPVAAGRSTRTGIFSSHSGAAALFAAC
jgi:hypothetical protein